MTPPIPSNSGSVYSCSCNSHPAVCSVVTLVGLGIIAAITYAGMEISAYFFTGFGLIPLICILSCKKQPPSFIPPPIPSTVAQGPSPSAPASTTGTTSVASGSSASPVPASTSGTTSIVSGSSSSSTSSSSSGSSSIRPPPTAERLDLSGIPQSITPQFQALDAAEKAILAIKDGIGKRNRTSAQILFSPEIIKKLAPFFEFVLEDFRRGYQTMFSYNHDYDSSLHSLRPGDQVPPYYAIASNNSTQYSLKYRSIMGWYNMLYYGGVIIDQLHEKLFDAREWSYDDRKGLRLIKYLVGNTVDLHQTLTGAKPNTQSTEQELIADAKRRVQHFKEEFREYESLPRSNKFSTLLIEVTSSRISHADRNTQPVWRFGSECYVNVPNTSEVIDAILLGSIRFLQAYLIIKSKYAGVVMQRHLDHLFDKAIPQSCLNGKLAAVLRIVDPSTITSSFAIGKPYRDQIYTKTTKTPLELSIEKYGKANTDNAKSYIDLKLMEPDGILGKFTNLPDPGKKYDSKQWIDITADTYFTYFTQNFWLNDFKFLYKTIDGTGAPTQFEEFNYSVARKLASLVVESDIEDRFTK